MTTKFEPPNAQRGISERPRQHLILAALTFNEGTTDDCHASIDALREIVRDELGDKIADPAVETGELGYESHYDDYQLIITFALSTSGYDRLAVPPDARPIDLHPAPADVLNPLDPNTGPEIIGEGDILLHVASDDAYIVEHVLRRVQNELTAQLAVTWVQTGVQRYTTRQQGSRETQRALIGFLDGTANLSMSDPADRGLVYVDHARTDYPPNPTPDAYAGATFPTDLRQPPTGPEPIVCDGGSYLAVEVLTINREFWDQQPVPKQERIVGRTKMDGQPATNAIPASHTLKANPHRNADDELRRFLRRGYPLIRPYGSGLGLGLVFIAFGRSLTTQVEFVRRAWINNPNFPTAGAGEDALMFGGAVNPRLLVGGYYFAPPLVKSSDPASWVVATPTTSSDA
jgi:Dyp-type peroxidase family